eukprot:4950319-Pyramimonas_sp.AAC.3
MVEDLQGLYSQAHRSYSYAAYLESSYDVSEQLLKTSCKRQEVRVEWAPPGHLPDSAGVISNMHVTLFAVCLVTVLSCSQTVLAFEGVEEDPFSYHEVDADGYWVKAGGGGGLRAPPKNGTLGANNTRTLATGYFLSEAAETNRAWCLDGTPGLYYLRPGFGNGVKKWLVHHQGGGWCQSLNCTDEPCPLDSCYVRSGGSLGSTQHDRNELILEGGYFDSDPASNPSFYDWNIVLLRYCDGSSFSGLRDDTVVVGDRELHFRGFAILQAMIDDLLTNRGLQASTDVVISGCSAGGLATYLHLDYWAERIHANT